MLSFLVRQIVIAIKKEKTWTYLTFFDNRPEAFSEKRWFYNLQREKKKKKKGKNLGQFKLRVSNNWKHLRYSRDLRPLNLQLYW